MKNFILFLFIVSAYPVYAQYSGHQEHMDKNISGMNMKMDGMYGNYSMSRESSGTSWQPDSTPLQGLNFMHKEWMIMMDGYINAVYDCQRGEREDKKAFSSSMFMFMTQRPFNKGTLGLRGMFSLDPLMNKKGYPLLLQTGETSDGVTPLIDRQHPHDLFMELATVYSKSVFGDGSVFVYFGLPGEPALGPPAFMHRFSGRDIPGAPITHHWIDSTHITYGVLTSGYIWKNMKIEGSIFKGREPNQNRWDIEFPEFDSASGRISFNPAKNWSMQISFGYLDSPEQLEPDVDTRRTIASISYNMPFSYVNWQTTFAWGRNDNQPGKTLDGVILESTICIKDIHSLFSRFERVTKDELFLEGNSLYKEEFAVNKITLGYIYDMSFRKYLKWGIGSSLDINVLPDRLKPSYGDDPLGYMIFVRVKLD